MINYNNQFIPIRKNLFLTDNLIFITTPIWIIGMIAAYLFVTDFTVYKLALACGGYFFFNILGITAGYHRYFCHKSFKVGKWKERLLLLAGTLAAQGPVIFWVALHRGYHHKNADTEKDPHSPIHGFWHSFILWMYRLSPEAVSLKYSVDWLKHKDVMFMSKHYKTIVLTFWAISALISIEFFLFFVMLPTMITIVTYNITNSATHIQSLGYKNFDTRDHSTNAPWLWPLVLGECWHNNHHGRAGDYYFGQKWWELDPAGLFIKAYKDGDK